MNFKRAKSILILLFALVDIFLLIIYQLVYVKTKSLSNEDIIAILNNNNITITSEVLSRDFPARVPEIEISNLAKNKKDLALKLLGEKISQTSTDTYSNGSAFLKFDNEIVEYETDSPDNEEFKSINQSNASDKLIKYLNNKEIGINFLYKYDTLSITDEEYNVILSYIFNKHPVFNHSINATVNNFGIKKIKGSFLNYKKIKGQQYHLSPIYSILLDFIDNKEISNKKTVIKEISFGYYLPVDKLEASTYAIPAYKIKTDDNYVYFYDARKDISSEFRFLYSKKL